MEPMIATIERGTTHWTARLLESTRGPDWFIPQGDYPQTGVINQYLLSEELMRTYPEIEIVTPKEFNTAVATALSTGLDELCTLANMHGYQVYMENMQLQVMRHKTDLWPSTLGLFDFSVSGMCAGVAWLHEGTKGDALHKTT